MQFSKLVVQYLHLKTEFMLTDKQIYSVSNCLTEIETITNFLKTL